MGQWRFGGGAVVGRAAPADDRLQGPVGGLNAINQAQLIARALGFEEDDHPGATADHDLRAIALDLQTPPRS